MFDPNSKLLRVACTGDCRAVLGRRDPKSGKYIAIALSKDQTGFNELELARVRAEHPNEPDVIDTKTGRMLGHLAPSRAFGDGMYKWSLEVVQECRDKFFGVAPWHGYLSPPYITAEPVVTTTEMRGHGEFLIVASDGLWDHMSSEQAVQLVEMWVAGRNNEKIGKGAQKHVPVPTKAKGLKEDELKIKDENFVVEDKNVATHLARNALGGRDLERLCGVIGAQPPLSRSARDDITVQVVFVGDNG
jgi:pyruvate dehydrogenase phosphatase